MIVRNLESSELPSLVRLLLIENLCVDDINNNNHVYRGLFLNDLLRGGYGLEIYGQMALLRSVILDVNARGKGYGISLLKDAIFYAEDRGVDSLYLLTITASKFFSTLGFQQVNRLAVPEPICQTVEFKSFCPDTAVCMKLTIPTYV